MLLGNFAMRESQNNFPKPTEKSISLEDKWKAVDCLAQSKPT